MLGALATSAVSVLHGVGTLALVAVAICMLQSGRPWDATGWRQSLLIGLLFGAAVALVMVDPIVFPMGVTIDARGGPTMLAGIYGGPLAAALAAGVGGAMRWSIGGDGMLSGLIGLAIYAAVGVLGHVRLRRVGRQPTLGWLLGLAVLGSLLAVPAALAHPDWRYGLRLLTQAWWLVLAGNVLAVLVLGFLLEQERRRRRLELELRQSEARTRAAADAKTRFLASMSHEIRTPMNAVVGFVDLLRDSSLDSFQRRCTDQIRDAAHGLLRIIDDILDFAKIDAGGVVLDPQPVDVTDLVENCRELMLPQLERKGVACTLDLESRLPGAVEADPDRLRQVLLNVLGNAVKFTDAGRISVTVTYAPEPSGERGELGISVADTGVGIAPEDLQRLFNPFSQGNHVGRGGTGLGLVISRMLVEAMGGTLTLESVLGEGTTVQIRLPVRERSPAPAAEQRQPAIAGEESVLRILVAEDVEINAEMLRATLEQAGHIVAVAANGQEAVEALNLAPFDLILMDVQMPVMDGLAATRAIRSLQGPAAMVPIVALTAYASREDLKACLDAGMNDFLTKPLERSKLHEVLHRWAGPGHGTAEAAQRVAPSDPRQLAGESMARVRELLTRLVEAGRGDREAVRSMADSLAAAAAAAGLDSLADRSRRLVAAAPVSNADALGALIDDVAEAGRRSLQSAGGAGPGDRR